MSNIQYYWSEQSRMEFLALFDDGQHSASFKDSVAEAIAKGWQGNRDKPFWAMSLLVATLSCCDKQQGDGLDLVTLMPSQLQEKLNSLPKEKQLEFSPIRIAVLRKVTEFFLAANNFANADKIMKIFARLAQAQNTEPALIKTAGQELAQMAYHYRKEHFLDAHAASSFSIVKKFFAIRRDFHIDDKAIFDFWVWPETQGFQTYRKAYGACHDFYVGLQEAGIIDAMTKAASVDEPIIALSLAAVEENISYSQEEDHSANDMIKLLTNSDLKPLTKKELDFLALTLECGTFGTRRSRSCLRLLSFHPVQSAISNSLRTGQSKIPLEDRVLCPEAAPYQDIIERLTNLEEKVKNILKISLSLRQQENDTGKNSEKEQALIDQGIVLLKKKRSQRWDRSPQELKQAFGLLEEALIDILSQLTSHLQAMATILKHDEHQQIFLADKEDFSQQFKALYLNTNSPETK